MVANTDAFLLGLGRAGVETPGELAVSLAAAVATARKAWPDLEVPEDQFLQHLGRCLQGEGTDYLSLIPDLEIADLYLCFGCLLGNRSALEHLENAHLKSIPSFIAHLDRTRDFGDEVAQQVRRKLLVVEAEQTSKLAQYLGQGPLRGWIAVVAQRTALDLMRAQNRMPRMDDSALEQHLSVGADPDMALVKSRLRSHFEEALREALAALGVRERTLLRLTLIAGLSLDRVGAMYRVNPSTVSRWLSAAREELLARMQRHLRETRNLDPAELESMVRLVRSQVDVSLSGLLAEER